MGQGVQGCGCSPLNSFLRKSRSCARPRGSVRSSLKLKPQRSTRSFVGVCTLRATPALGQAWPHPPPCTPCIGVEGGTGAGSPPEGAYVGAFMAQYVVSSVIQGLLGRQPDMMGSWGMYCSLNLMYLPGAAAGGGQDHRPTAATGPSHRGAVLGL